MIFHENRYFWKSGKIWNCRLLHIIGGALWVKIHTLSYLGIALPGGAWKLNWALPCDWKTKVLWWLNFFHDHVGRSVAKGFIMLKPTKIFGELRDIWPCYFTFQIANDKGADQTARMRRLICAFVIRNKEKSGFLVSMPIWCWSPGFLTFAWLRAWYERILIACTVNHIRI